MEEVEEKEISPVTKQELEGRQAGKRGVAE